MTQRLEEALRKALSPADADGPACSEMLYRHVSGQLSQNEEARFAEHLRGCLECRIDLDLLQRGAAAPSAPRRSLRSVLAVWLRPLVVASLVGVVAICALHFGRSKAPGGSIAVLTPKGGPTLHIAVRRGDQELTLVSGQPVKEGDMLGFFYSAAAPSWPVIMFADEAGKVQPVFPREQLELVPAGVEQPLPVSAVVEPAQGCEWLVAFFADKAHKPSIPVLTEALREAARRRRSDCSLEPLAVAGIPAQIVPLRHPVPQ